MKFHDGQEFTADDVVYTLNFVAKPENKVTTQANVNWIDHAEKVDPYKVRIVTKQIFPAAIEYLAGPVVIHPHLYYEKVGPAGQNQKPDRVGDLTGSPTTCSASRSRSSAILITSRIRPRVRRRSPRSRSASFRIRRPGWPR